jgi:hypothetical protein
MSVRTGQAHLDWQDRTSIVALAQRLIAIRSRMQ